MIRPDTTGRQLPVVRLLASDAGEAARALDMLALALAAHDHEWSTEEREAYEGAIAILIGE